MITVALADGATIDDFLPANDVIREEYTSQQPGYIGRQMGVTEDAIITMCCHSQQTRMKEKQMKIAITAANGQLGTEIIKATIALHARENVIGLARTPDKAKNLGIEIRPGDYNDKSILEKSLQFVDALLLISGMDAPERRIEQHRNVIQAARNAGVRKIVYTSVQGAEEDTAFSPIVQSNRQTEQDIRGSGLDWVIGRNGIYIEPDIEYIEAYKKTGGISNCAGEGRCGYTTRPELAYAYAQNAHPR